MHQQKRWDPEHYFKNSATQLGHAKGLIEQYLFRGDENILDIGCGDGKITAALSQFVPNGHVTGIDISTEMLDFAQQAFPPESFMNLSFQQCDVLNLDRLNTPSPAYDLIVSFSCLHYVRQKAVMLQNIARALKPNGKLIFMLYRKCPIQWAAINKIANSQQWASYFKDFDPGYYEYLPDTFQQMLNQYNLSQFTATFTPVEQIAFESKNIFNKFMRGWLPHLQRLPVKKHDDFMDQVVDAYLDGLGVNGEGAISIPFLRLIVT